MNSNENALKQTLKFPYLENADEKMYSPLALAYIGDAVYEMYVRAHVMEKGNMPVNKLHRLSTHYVSAKAQSKIIHEITDELNEEELSVFKRGRNAHSYTSAKNADITDYRHATGFEALVGYVFIKGDFERLNQLITLSIEKVEDLSE